MVVQGKNLVLKNKNSIFIDESVIIGDNVTIYENNRIEGASVIGDGTVLLPNNYIVNSKIGINSVINCSQLDSVTIGNDCNVGPFAFLRSNAVLKNGVRVGNYVEVKNSVIGENTMACHLAYIGDANIGKNCNIGCGAIFVNYNGRVKNKTIVGDNCFIGSNCNLIAPVNIENNAYICAGTTITDDVHSDDFVIGRARQEIKENRAHKYLKEKNED